MKRIIIITCMLSTSICYAKKGNTAEESITKYGEPIGTAGNQKRKIRIYDTPTAKITETYDANGICIHSVKKYKTQATQKIHRTRQKVKPTTYTVKKITNQPTNKIKTQAPPTQATRTTPEKTYFAKTIRNATPFAFTIIALSGIIGFGIALIKKRSKPA